MFGNLLLYGEGHYTTKGEIKSPLWTWSIQPPPKKGEELPLTREEVNNYFLSGEKGLQFISEMYQLLPKDVTEFNPEGGRVVEPIHIPGDSCEVILPLNDCLGHEQVKDIVMKFFPELWKKFAPQ